jgi:hypothetical protein
MRLAQDPVTDYIEWEITAMKTLTLLLMFVCSTVTLVVAQDQGLTLIAEKDSYIVGDPVVVFVTVTNRSAKVLEVPILFGPEYDTYVYTIQGPDGNAVRFSPLMVKETYAPKASLEQGQSVSGSARIYFGALGYSFMKPGPYSIRCSFGPQISNELMLKFGEPETAPQRAFADAILRHGEVGLLLMMEGGDELADGIAQLQKIASEFPESPYGGIAGYILGKNYSQPAMNFVSKKPRAADFAKANKYLEAARGVNIGPFYVSQLHATLGDNYLKMKDPDAARKIDEELQRRLKGFGRPGDVMLEERTRLQTMTR